MNASAAAASRIDNWYALGLLMVVGLFNYIDRLCMSILQVSIKQELNLSDTQLGVLTGLAFSLLYTTMARTPRWPTIRCATPSACRRVSRPSADSSSGARQPFPQELARNRGRNAALSGKHLSETRGISREPTAPVLAPTQSLPGD